MYIRVCVCVCVYIYTHIFKGFPSGSAVKNPPAMQETQTNSFDS